MNLYAKVYLFHEITKPTYFSDTMIVGIQKAVSIPVVAKARIGHIIEARVPEVFGIDCIDESEVLTPADDAYHIFKTDFKNTFYLHLY